MIRTAASPICWSSLDGTNELPLLSLLARPYQIENATLTTRSESLPAPASPALGAGTGSLQRPGAMVEAVTRRRGPAEWR
jgi:hypothetical protein